MQRPAEHDFPGPLPGSRGRQDSYIDDMTEAWSDQWAETVDLNWDLARQLDNPEKLDISVAQDYGQDPTLTDAIIASGNPETKGTDVPDQDWRLAKWGKEWEEELARLETAQGDGIIELGPEDEVRGFAKLVFGERGTPHPNRDSDLKGLSRLIGKDVSGQQVPGFRFTTDDTLPTPVEETLTFPATRYRTPAGGQTTNFLRARTIEGPQGAELDVIPMNKTRATFEPDRIGVRGINKGRRAEINIRLDKIAKDLEDAAAVEDITAEDVANYLRVEFGDDWSTVQDEAMRIFLQKPIGKAWMKLVGQPRKVLNFETSTGMRAKGDHVSVSPRVRAEDRKKFSWETKRGPGSRGLDKAQKEGAKARLPRGPKPGDKDYIPF